MAIQMGTAQNQIIGQVLPNIEITNDVPDRIYDVAASNIRITFSDRVAWSWKITVETFTKNLNLWFITLYALVFFTIMGLAKTIQLVVTVPLVFCGYMLCCSSSETLYNLAHRSDIENYISEEREFVREEQRQINELRMDVLQHQ